MGTARILARVAWSYTLLAFGGLLMALICFTWALVAIVLNLVLPAAAARRVGRYGAMASFRIFLTTMEAVGAMRLEIHELDQLRDAGPLIIAPNHPCLLDAVLVVSRLPNALCVMKRALLGTFLLGPAARLARYVRNDSLLRLAARADEELRLGGHLLIFPEGTRSTADPVGPFTEAVGALSRRSKVPVQTIVIETDSRFLGKGWLVTRRPELPLAYRVRLGRRFDPPKDVRAFTVELERYFSRELAARTAPLPAAQGRNVEEAQRIRG
jgi:1-acyl-sn-glycerol-3-phosphate acyltransferase